MQRARILVVDDEHSAVEILGRVLKARGHTVAGAGSAEEALELLGKSSFDIVFLDLVLPGITGLQAIAKMRPLTKAPIHIMSGQNDAQTRDDAILLGAATFIPKPLDLRGLQELIETLPPV